MRFALMWLFSVGLANAETIRLSEPVTEDVHSETFGIPLDTSVHNATLAQLAQTPADYVQSRFLLRVPIAKVCQKKGCFFIASDGEHRMRVAFNDYSFFIPTDSSGKTVTLNGELVRVERSAEKAAHFSQDLQSAERALQSGVTYEINAFSVRVPKG
ncbi:DUF4920 domain-containing protein [Alteromonas sp. MYP5]|uniref:DUF4920 domain-containing protein n=2 Tax=Alteromonas ponticola TaxID=2720613 RepID=A0ABX1R4F7_9ALTE|nr:DUF4920 domain-containing protein [Alteromonas ponticola]